MLVPKRAAVFLTPLLVIEIKQSGFQSLYETDCRVCSYLSSDHRRDATLLC